MKYVKILPILLLSSVIFLYSCNDKTKAPKQDNSKSIDVENSATKPAVTTPTPAEPAQNASGVWHYTCRIGCPGGAGSATKCNTCGNILAHNTAYHGNANSTSSAPFSNAPATPATPATPAAPEPAQNSAGVWHYTCAKGCVGGSGSAGSCTTCNGPLAHNSAYH